MKKIFLSNSNQDFVVWRGKELDVNKEIEELRAENERLQQRLDRQIENIYDLVCLQSQNGNWNYNDYMRGMANGLICAYATLNGSEPNYLNTPSSWLENIPSYTGSPVSLGDANTKPEGKENDRE